MIEEQKLLRELIELMDTDVPPNVTAILRIAQRAESLFETERPLSMEIDPSLISPIFFKLEDIIRPAVPYNEDHLKMGKWVIDKNQETARDVFVSLEMLIK